MASEHPVSPRGKVQRRNEQVLAATYRLTAWKRHSACCLIKPSKLGGKSGKSKALASPSRSSVDLMYRKSAKILKSGCAPGLPWLTLSRLAQCTSLAYDDCCRLRHSPTNNRTKFSQLGARTGARMAVYHCLRKGMEQWAMPDGFSVIDLAAASSLSLSGKDNGMAPGGLSAGDNDEGQGPGVGSYGVTRETYDKLWSMQSLLSHRAPLSGQPLKAYCHTMAASEGSPGMNGMAAELRVAFPQPLQASPCDDSAGSLGAQMSAELRHLLGQPLPGVLAR
eukprot:505955-Pelagomonas_calceolata.AAC.6